MSTESGYQLSERLLSATAARALCGLVLLAYALLPVVPAAAQVPARTETTFRIYDYDYQQSELARRGIIWMSTESAQCHATLEAIPGPVAQEAWEEGTIETTPCSTPEGLTPLDDELPGRRMEYVLATADDASASFTAGASAGVPLTLDASRPLHAHVLVSGVNYGGVFGPTSSTCAGLLSDDAIELTVTGVEASAIGPVERTLVPPTVLHDTTGQLTIGGGPIHEEVNTLWQLNPAFYWYRQFHASLSLPEQLDGRDLLKLTFKVVVRGTNAGCFAVEDQDTRFEVPAFT